MTCRMTRVNDDGQMAQVVDDGNGGKVKRVSRVTLVSADASLAENNILVSACHNVLGAGQKLLDRVGKPSLEKDGLIGFSELL